MKEKAKTIPSPAREKTNPLLLRALALMKHYTQTTRACICIHDHNYLIIPELYEEVMSEKNICLFCIKYKKNREVKCFQDFSFNPCGDMHINAIKESHRFGGSYAYVCPLGFIFWTSPIYFEKRFAGALLGGGFLGSDSEETCALMRDMCGGSLPKTELRKMLACFPRGDGRKIKSLAELMLVCAQSLSMESDGCHRSMKHRMKQQSEISAGIEELKNRYPAGAPRPEYPLGKERELLDALKKGDVQSAKEKLNKFLAALFLSNPDEYKYIQYRALELGVLLFRTDTSPGLSFESALETNNHFFNSIQEARNIEELAGVLYRIVDTISGQILAFQGIHHAAALKKAEYFILENFTRKINLKEIARISGFSAPYFSTIFKEGMGENLSAYINRMRVEKAAYMLVNTNVSLGTITRACGFEDQSWFSKIFKTFTGVSPGKFREQGGMSAPKIFEPVFSGDYLHLLEKNDARNG